MVDANIEYVDDLMLTDVKKILSEKKKTKELSYEQKMAYEHAKLFTKLTPVKAEKLKADLLELDLTAEVVATIVDVLPNKYQLDLLAEKNKCIAEENKEKILELVEKNKKEK